MDVNVQNSLENFNFYANMNIKSTEKLKTYVLCIWQKWHLGTSKNKFILFYMHPIVYIIV